MNDTYYVYAYLRKDGSPYYIGKGKGNRMYVKQKGQVGKPRDRSKIILVEQNLTEIGALALERRLIRWYGRIDIGTGILRNKTDGGDGISGYKFTDSDKLKISVALTGKKRKQFSTETTDRMSKAQKGRTVSDETRKKIRDKATGRKQSAEAIAKRVEKIKGSVRSIETREKISKIHKGKIVSEETKQLMSAAAKNRPVLICPHCNKQGSINNMKRWHFDNCKTRKK